MFEKRKNATSQTVQTGFSVHAGPDLDGIRRIIPLEMWSGKLGKQLRGLGLSPNDSNNLVSDQTAIERRFEDKYHEQTMFFEHYNHDPLAGVKVLPFAMLPWQLWQSDHAEFLIRTCEFYPVEAWNTLMLPEDADGASMLDLVAHPRGYPGEYITGCNNVIGQVRDEFIEQYRVIERDVMAGDCKAIERHTALVENTRRNVAGASVALAAMLLTEAVYMRHQALFGHLF